MPTYPPLGELANMTAALSRSDEAAHRQMVMIVATSSVGVALLIALLVTLVMLRRTCHARRSRPAVVLAMSEVTSVVDSGGHVMPMVVDASTLSAVELAQLDVVGTTTSPPKRDKETPQSRLIGKQESSQAI